MSSAAEPKQPITVRLSPTTAEEVDALASDLCRRDGAGVSRSDVLRRAVRRGLTVLRAEFDRSKQQAEAVAAIAAVVAAPGGTTEERETT